MDAGKTSIILLGLAVLASGCAEKMESSAINSSENNTSEPEIEYVSCKEIDISIYTADAESAIVRQMTEKAAGKVSLTWDYSSGEYTDNANLTTRGRMRTFETGRTGELENFRVESVRCPEKVFEQ